MILNCSIQGPSGAHGGTKKGAPPYTHCSPKGSWQMNADSVPNFGSNTGQTNMHRMLPAACSLLHASCCMLPAACTDLTSTL